MMITTIMIILFMTTTTVVVGYSITTFVPQTMIQKSAFVNFLPSSSRSSSCMIWGGKPTTNGRSSTSSSYFYSTKNNKQRNTLSSSLLYAQKPSSSSSSSYEYLWNYTDSLAQHSVHKIDDDFIALQTSNALEMMENNNHMNNNTDDREREDISSFFSVPSIPNDISNKGAIEEPEMTATAPTTTTASSDTVDRTAALEPHIYHMNKALVDTIYNILCTLYPTKSTTTTTTTTTTSGSSDDDIGKHIEKSYARFYVLETIARVPYFAYLCVLHLRESLGDRSYSGVYTSSSNTNDSNAKNDNSNNNNDVITTTTSTDVNNSRLRTHYAEADNELHHLLIMESLGGNSNPMDRMIAQTMAVGYYFYVLLVYVMISPQAAYHLSELIEDHAYNTYDEFLTTYEYQLKQLPVPSIAKQYYMDDNPFLQDLFRTVKDTTTTTTSTIADQNTKKNVLNSLYDVFVCIRNDEKEHWKTLCTLVQYDQLSAVSVPAVPVEDHINTTMDDTATTKILTVQSSQPKSISDTKKMGWF